MSTCEKCWADARRSGLPVADEYRRLLEDRKGAPCTPEEQAGKFAEVCPTCKRRTLNQHTGECMAGRHDPRPGMEEVQR